MNLSRPTLTLAFGLLTCIPAVAAEPNFVMPSQAQYRAKYATASSIYKNDYEAEQLDYTTFIDMLVDAWLHDHRPKAEGGEGRWEMPAANDWVGCVLYEFPRPEIFKRIEFRSYTRSRDLKEWVAQHEQTIAQGDDGTHLVERFKALPEWSRLCEDLVRGDDGMSL